MTNTDQRGAQTETELTTIRTNAFGDVEIFPAGAVLPPIVSVGFLIPKEAVENLIEAIPSQSNDVPWWPDELIEAVDDVKSLFAAAQVAK